MSYVSGCYRSNSGSYAQLHTFLKYMKKEGNLAKNVIYGSGLIKSVTVYDNKTTILDRKLMCIHEIFSTRNKDPMSIQKKLFYPFWYYSLVGPTYPIIFTFMTWTNNNKSDILKYKMYV